MKHETPRDAEGNKLCAWCGGRIRQSGLGRSRDYCKQSCRQRAYEERKVAERIAEAVAARRDSSRDDGGPDPSDSPRDETRPAQVETPIPAPAEPEEDYLLAPPVAAVVEPGKSPVLPDAWRAGAPVRPSIPLPPPGVPRSKRRRLMPPPPGATGEELTLWSDPADANGE